MESEYVLDAAANTGASLDRLFESQVDRQPRAVAVADEEQELTYGQLELDANRLARRLRDLGVGPDVVVAVCLERSRRMVTAVLAVLKAGGAYLPLDPAHPRSRLQFMLRDSQASILVTDGTAPFLHADHTVLVDDPQAPHPSGTRLCIDRNPGELAYLIYTSGSTGSPKAVMVEHRQVLRLFSSTRPLFGFDGTDVWTMTHSFAFDFSVWEMWGALAHGGRLVIVSREVARCPQSLRALVADEGVTVLSQTPGAFRHVVEHTDVTDGDWPATLRWVVFGGDALNTRFLASWFERQPYRPRLVNMYGITEVCVHATWRVLKTTELYSVTGMVGSGLPDMTVRPLDPSGRPVRDGETGEIFVGGAGVARGYWRRPGLTAERFLPDPDAAHPGARMYRSGDAGTPWGHDLQYRGRLDRQVKIRGHRVELGEVENAVAAVPGVGDVAVVPESDSGGEVRLVAHCSGAGRDGGADLRSALRHTLPDYMVPARVESWDALPLTANGKVDRAALARAHGDRSRQARPGQP